MNKEEQTKELKIRLYDLTRQFVFKYQPRYYKQMDKKRENYEDLISEFYCSFLTEKSRVKGKEQSLLDKFDPSVTSLEYLVKIAVQRKLIDWSRKYPYKPKSIEEKLDEYGDCVLQGLNLVYETNPQIEDKEFTLSEVEAIKRAFSNLDDYSKKVVSDKFQEIKNVIVPSYKKVLENVIQPYLDAKSKANEFREYVVSVLDEVGNVLVCPMQQLTPKTVVVLIGDEFYNFDRYTGKSRNKCVLKEIDMQCLLEYNQRGEVIKPLLSREEFLDRYK